MVDVVKIHIFADVVSVAVGVAIIVAAAVDYVVDIIVADVIAIDANEVYAVDDDV